MQRMGQFWGGQELVQEFKTPVHSEATTQPMESKVQEGVALTSRGIGKLINLETGRVSVLKMPLKPRIIFLCGKPETGKSTDLRSLMLSYNLDRYFEGGVYWTSGGGIDDPNMACFDRQYYIEATKKAVQTHAKRLLEEYKKANAAGRTMAPNAFVIEDATGWVGGHTSSGKNIDYLKVLIGMHRHPQTTMIIVGHEATAVMPLFRKSSNLTIARSCNTEDHWERIRKDNTMCLPKVYKKKPEFLEMVSIQCNGNRGMVFRSSRSVNDAHIYESHNVTAERFKMHKPRFPVIKIEQPNPE